MNSPVKTTTEIENQLRYLNTQLVDHLNELSNSEANGCLQLTDEGIIYFIYINQGKLIYATNSLAPFERLERHLRRLSNLNHNLTNEVIKQGRLQFRTELEHYPQIPSDYQSILWLLTQNYLNHSETSTLVRRVTREVFESLLINNRQLQDKFTIETQQLTKVCNFDLITFVEQCQRRLQEWQAFLPEVWSSYQRPYLVNEFDNNLTNLTNEQKETICKLLKGLNFRQISALIDKDELIVAKILYPSIVNHTIIVREPKSPFDVLPRTTLNFDQPSVCQIDNFQANNHQHINSNSKSTILLLEKQWKIAYVDHSIDTQERIKEILNNQTFSVTIIKDSTQAFAELIELQPELIFIEVNLPNINGYELCSLLKNNHTFKTTPIILVTDSRGLINLTKSKLVGASDYITKPFNQSNILSIIFKYLRG